MWAVGILVHGLLTGFFPFRSEDPRELDKEIKETWFNASDFEGIPKYEISEECRDWMRMVLDPRNEGKFSAKDLLAHPWLASIPDFSAWPAPYRPVPSLPESTKDHRYVCKVVAEHLQERLPTHRAEMKRLVFPSSQSHNIAAPKALRKTLFKPTFSFSAYTSEDDDHAVDFCSTPSDATSFFRRTPSPFAPSEAGTVLDSLDESLSTLPVPHPTFHFPQYPTSSSLLDTENGRTVPVRPVTPNSFASHTASPSSSSQGKHNTMKRWFAKFAGRV